MVKNKPVVTRSGSADNGADEELEKYRKSIQKIALWISGGFGTPTLIGGIIAAFVNFDGLSLSYLLLGGAAVLLVVFYRLAPAWNTNAKSAVVLIFGSILLALSILLYGTESPTGGNFVWFMMLGFLLLGRMAALAIILFGATVFFIVNAMQNWFGYHPFGLAPDSNISMTVTISWLVFFILNSIIILVFFSNLERLRKAANAAARQAIEYNHSLEQRQKVGEKVSGRIHEFTLELTAASSQQESGSQQQAAAITEILATVEELSHTASSIAANATGVNQSTEVILAATATVDSTTQEAVKSGERGLVAMEETIQSNQQMMQHYQDLLDNLNQLAAYTRNVESIVNLIRSIADETHLLSLNAAIEAAGADERGARFGVVAQEVKNLADNSLRATADVRQIINHVSEALTNCLVTAEEGRSQAVKAFEVAKDSSRVISGLASVVEQAAGQVGQIAHEVTDMRNTMLLIQLSTQQQKEATDQVTRTLGEVGSVARQNATSSQQLSNAVRELEELSGELQVTLETGQV